MLDLIDIRNALQGRLERHEDFPYQLAAFIGWITSNDELLRARIDEVVALSDQSRHPEHVAALGYGAASGLLSQGEATILQKEIDHLTGRKFFVPGRPLRFEVDGLALLGVALGVATQGDADTQEWLAKILAQSSVEVAGDEWQLGFIRAARLCTGMQDLKVVPPDLAIAMISKGIGEMNTQDLEQAWTLASSLQPHDCGPERDAVQLAVFEHVLARRGQIAISSANRDDLTALLQNISRSMRLWTFETKKRTPRSSITRWNIENEYHVQNLLWTILAPVFSDIEDEENLPSIGHKNPRADLGIPSLRTIIEVKFMRAAGQRACAKIIEEIAADASLYLSKTATYDNIIAFVWDDCAQTEQYDELRAGLTAIDGVTNAIILPRPSKMRQANWGGSIE